jgi:hypothetical protein
MKTFTPAPALPPVFLCLATAAAGGLVVAVTGLHSGDGVGARGEFVR